MRNLAPLEIARHAGPLDELEEPWRRLVDPTRFGAPFHTPAWISSWWSCASTSGEAEVLVARRGDELVGILPLYAERSPLGARRLRLMGDGIVGSDGLGAIAQPARRDEVSRAFAVHLGKQLIDRSLHSRGGWDQLQLDDLLADDPLIAPLDAELEQRYRCPCIRIDGDFDGYVRSLPGGIAEQLRRRERWLAKQDGFAVETLTTPDEVARGLRILFELHRRRWALEGGSDAIDGPRLEAFHLEAGRGLARLGWARVWLLHVDGAPRAALYGFCHGDRLAFYQTGHDPVWRPRSVGTVLLAHVIRTAFDEKRAWFDFLRGEEPYKLAWANSELKTVRLRARGAALRPRLEERARRGWSSLKALARAALPDATFLRLQQWKKQLARRGDVA